MKVLTGIAIGLSKGAKSVANVSGFVGNYILEDVKSVPNGFKAGWKTPTDKKVDEIVAKYKEEPK